MSAALYVHIFSILGSTFASGASQGLNYFALPPITQLAPTPSLKINQFARAHWTGHITLPITFIACGLMHFGLAYAGATANSTLEVAAGAITISIYPLSSMFIEQLYLYLYTLRGKKDEEIVQECASQGGVDALIVKWQKLNTLRAALPFVGALVSAWNLMGSVKYI